MSGKAGVVWNGTDRCGAASQGMADKDGPGLASNVRVGHGRHDMAGLGSAGHGLAGQ
jgi:hypothetical protein